jgi:hypothetical protein
MSDTYLQLTPPNTCCLLYNSTELEFITYLAVDYETKIWPGAGKDEFEQFVTPDEAAARARELYPEFNTNPIYGFLSPVAVNISNPTEAAYAGTDLTLHCEYECADATVTYQWKNPGGLVIPSATTSAFTLSNLTEKLDGTYTCVVSASNNKGQTGSATGSFAVTVYPSVGAAE